MFPLGAILDIGSKLVDKFFPDAQQAEQAKLKLLEMQQNGELAQLAAATDLAKLQIQTNLEEAKSTNWFVAGWRPFVGWICGAGLAYVAIFEPVNKITGLYLGFFQLIAIGQRLVGSSLSTRGSLFLVVFTITYCPELSNPNTSETSQFPFVILVSTPLL